MADNNIKVSIQVSDNGTSKEPLKNAKELKQAYDGAAASAKKVGGTAGSRQAAEMSNQGYNAARGTAGVTGASARDFANQAQGLGGLVRLYATYAANVFAVGAAFRALSSAMDTTNMISGLDQLGAASGRNLGSIAKRMTEVSDGAISMREAMEATAKTTSAGMSSKDIERLTVVAKNASQALGVAMPDAISRLSRGITKLEPELLDELGLFTKIGPATDEYARGLGKTASQLTDFEKRQAFANAVLKEGEEKFSAIALQANPYDKLIASLKDLVQTGLSAVNTVFGPILNALSQSPTALTGVIGFLGVTLLKQAIPAIGQFRQGLQATANQARDLADIKVQDAVKAREALAKLSVSKLDDILSDEAAKVGAVEKQITELKGKEWSKRSNFYKLTQKDIEEVTQKDIDAAYKSIDAADRKFEAQKRAGSLTADQIAKEQTRLDLSRQQVAATDSASKAFKKAVDEEIAQKIAAEKSDKGWSATALTMQARQEALKRSVVSGAVANASYNASLVGMRGAYRLAVEEIKKSDIALTKWEMTVAKAKIGLAAFAGRLAGLGALFNKALGALATIATVLSLFDMALSGAAKEIGKAESAIDDFASAAEGAQRTLEHLNKNGAINSTTIDGIKAASSALLEVSSSASAAVDSTLKAKSAMGVWDTLKDKFFSVFGAGLDDKLTDTLTNGIKQALKLAEKSGRGAEAQQQILNALGITELTSSNISKAVEEAISKDGGKSLTLGLQKISNTAGEASAKIDDYKTSLKDTKLAYEQFIQSTTSNDPLFKLGTSLETLALKTRAAVGGTVEELNSMFIELQNTPLVNAVLGGDVSAVTIELFDLKQEQAKIKDYQAQVISAEEEIQNEKVRLGAKSNQQLLDEIDRLEQSGQSAEEYKKFEEAYKKLQDLKSNPIKLDEAKIAKVQATLAAASIRSFELGSQLIEQALGNATKKANATIDKANSQFLLGEDKAKEDLRIRNEEIKTRITAIQTNIDLILSNSKLTAAVEEATAQRAAEKAPGDVAAQEKFLAAQIVQDVLSSIGSKSGITDFNKAIIQSLQKFGATSTEFSGLSKNIEALVRGALQGAKTSTAGQRASKAQAEADLTASDIQGQAAIEKARTEEKQKQLKLANEALQVEQKYASIADSIVGYKTEQQIIAQQNIDAIIAENNYNSELLEINRQIANAKKLGSKAENTVASLERNKNALTNKYIQEATNKTLQNSIEILKAREVQRKKDSELVKSAQQVEIASARASLELQQKKEQDTASLLGLSQEYANYLTYIQTIEKANLDNSIAKRNIELQYSDQIIQREQELKLIKEEIAKYDPSEGGLPQALIDNYEKINSELERQKQLRQDAIDLAEIERKKIEEQAAAVKQLADALEARNQRIKDTEQFSQALEGIWKDTGKAIGDAFEQITKTNIASENLANVTNEILKLKTQMRDEEDNQGGVDPEKQEKLNKLSKEESKLKKDQLMTEAKLLGTAKKAFAEKTAAHRILAAAERAYYAFKIASEIQVQVQQAITAATGIAESIKGMTVKAGEAVTNSGKGGDPYTVIPRMAATAAFVAAIISSFGGKSAPSVPTGITAGQRQEIQGTSMAYNAQGEQYQFRQGVLGDPTEKLNTIANGIEIISATSVPGLNNDRGMLRLLQSIDANIEKLAATIFRTTGLTSGTAFGTQTGTSGGGGGIFGFLFGSSSTTTEIIDSGLKFSGTLNQLSEDAGSFIKFFETVQKTTTSSGGLLGSLLGGGGTSTSINTTQKMLSELGNTSANRLMLKQLQLVFGELGDAVRTLGEDLLGNSEDALAYIEGVLNSYEIDPETSGYASLRGLKGDELAEQLDAVFSGILSDIVSAAFPTEFVEKYMKVGEDYATTLIRLADTNLKVFKSLDNIGLTIDRAKLTSAKQREDEETANAIRENLTEAIEAYPSFFPTSEQAAQSAAEALASIEGSGTALADGYALATTNYFIKNIESANAKISQELYSWDDNNSFLGYEDVILTGSAAVRQQIKDVLGETVARAVGNDFSLLTQDQLQQLKEAGATWVGSIVTTATDAVQETFNQAQAEIDFTQALVDAVGGGDLEKYLERISFYRDNFLTESERLAQDTEYLRTSFEELGYTGIETAKQFRSLVEAVDINTDAGKETLAELMKLAPAFVEVYGAMEETSNKAKTLAERLKDAGLSADTFGNLITSAITGKLKPEEIGAKVQEIIYNGFYEALTVDITDEISKTISTSMIQPVLSSLLSGATAAAAVSQVAWGAVTRSIEAQIDSLVIILNDPSIKAAFNRLSGTITDFVTSLTGTSINSQVPQLEAKLADLEKQKLRAQINKQQKIIDGYNDEINILKETESQLKSTVDRLKSFINQVKDLKKSLLLGAQSPLTPGEKYAEARSQFQAVVAALNSSDETIRQKAQQDLSGTSSAFLEASRAMYSSSAQYTSDFNTVMSILSSAENSSVAQLSTAELQLKEAESSREALEKLLKEAQDQKQVYQDQLDALGSVNLTLDEILAEIERYNQLLEEEKARVAAAEEQLALEAAALAEQNMQSLIGSLAEKFTELDTTTDGLLNRDELVASGLATEDNIDELIYRLDTNGDGQVDRLEVIASYGEDSYYALRDITTILTLVNQGILDIATAQSTVDFVNQAYKDSGVASPYSDNISAVSGQASYSNGQINIQDYTPAEQTAISLYGLIGRSGIGTGVNQIDQAGLTYIAEQLTAMGIAEDMAAATDWWREAVNDYLTRLPEDPYSIYVSDYLKTHSFAKGSNYIPEDMIAQIHQGERIIPAADNERIMQSLANKDRTNEVLVQEIKKLNQKIERLEQTIADGDMMNAQATERNTQEVSRSISTAGSQASHQEAIRRRIKQ